MMINKVLFVSRLWGVNIFAGRLLTELRSAFVHLLSFITHHIFEYFQNLSVNEPISS